MGTWLTEVLVLSAVVIFAGALCLLPTILRDSTSETVKLFFKGNRQLDLE